MGAAYEVAGRRILVVDQHLDSVLALTTNLSRAKLEVTQNQSLEDAMRSVELSRSAPFDIAIMEVWYRGVIPTELEPYVRGWVGKDRAVEFGKWVQERSPQTGIIYYTFSDADVPFKAEPKAEDKLNVSGEMMCAHVAYWLAKKERIHPRKQ